MAKSVIAGVAQVNSAQKGTIVILIDDEGRFAPETEVIIDTKFIDRLKEIYHFKGERYQVVDAPAPEDHGFDRVILLGLGKAQKFYHDDWIKLGGAAYAALNKARLPQIFLAVDNYELSQNNLADFMIGLELAHYRFDKYKVTKKQGEVDLKTEKITIQCQDIARAKKALHRAQSIASGVILARNLVNEPANNLGPDEFVKEVEKLKKYGVKIDILDEKDLKKLSMNALLGVGQGAKRSPRVAIMQWNGGSDKDRPLAFIGKGVVFDSGGISLKPGVGMENMKGDMGGAAAVTGLMKTLALTDSNVNAVGVIGLVENMPDGAAQRPGDVVTSMSGQTIEVVNTDAEGRLVLADILWYTKKEFKPSIMVDLATLTGAILVALGQEYAGLFANDDNLAENLRRAGEITGEKVWRMPLAEAYDKIVDSKIADMRNSCGRNAGSITAAQFLQRFVADVAWAHLDIAGTAMESPQNEYNQSWASGFGVRLLYQMVSDFYTEQ